MAIKVSIIGAGPGGYPAALRLKALGAAVTLIEENNLGGTCLNCGCIPSKTFLDIGHRAMLFNGLAELMKEGARQEFKAEILNWSKVIKRKQDIIEKTRTSLERLFNARKIELIKGKARFSGLHKLKIETKTGELEKEFDYAIIACGTKPFCPPPYCEARPLIIDSDGIFDLKEKPQKMIIVGAGVIGLELACFFNALGADITILEILPDILINEDPQLRRVLRTSFEKRGIKFLFSRKAKSISEKAGIKTITLDDNSAIYADTVLVSAGRFAHLSDMGLESIGLQYSRKGIKTNNEMQTALNHIFAIGDINGMSMLAHSATNQGEAVAENIMNNAHKTFDSNLVPRCIYTWPESASIGLDIAAAEKLGFKAKASRAFNLALGKAAACGETEGFTQLVWNEENDEILGAQIVGMGATEIIHIIALAIKTHQTRESLKDLIFAHPTMSEAIKEAALK